MGAIGGELPIGGGTGEAGSLEALVGD